MASSTITKSLASDVASLNESLTNLSDMFVESAATASGSKSFTVANNTRALMYAQSASTADTGLWGIGVTSAGVVSVTAMYASSTLTITTGTRSITVANSSTRSPMLYFIVFDGSVS